MEITYIIIVGIVAYIFGAINKLFVEDVPNKFIPIQNVGIGLVSGIVCYFNRTKFITSNSFMLYVNNGCWRNIRFNKNI